MVLTLETLRVALGDETMLPDFGDRVDFVGFVNEALGHWGSHPWSYLQGRPFTFEVEAGTTELELDESVLRIDNVLLDRTWKVAVIAGEKFEELETYPVGGRRYWVTVRDLPSEEKELRGELTPWLILPSEHGMTGTLRVVADMAPRRQGPDREQIECPARLEPVMLALMRAFARGRFDVDSGGVDAELARLYAGPSWRRFASMEGAMMPIEMLADGPVGLRLNGRHDYDEDGPPPRTGRVIR